MCLLFLAAGAEVDGAAHVAGFLDERAAGLAGNTYRELAAAGGVATRLAEEIPLGVAPALLRHLLQGILH